MLEETEIRDEGADGVRDQRAGGGGRGEDTEPAEHVATNMVVY